MAIGLVFINAGKSQALLLTIPQSEVIVFQPLDFAQDKLDEILAVVMQWYGNLCPLAEKSEGGRLYGEPTNGLSLAKTGGEYRNYEHVLNVIFEPTAPDADQNAFCQSYNRKPLTVVMWRFDQRAEDVPMPGRKDVFQTTMGPTHFFELFFLNFPYRLAIRLNYDYEWAGKSEEEPRGPDETPQDPMQPQMLRPISGLKLLPRLEGDPEVLQWPTVDPAFCHQLKRANETLGNDYYDTARSLAETFLEQPFGPQSPASNQHIDLFLSLCKALESYLPPETT